MGLRVKQDYDAFIVFWFDGCNKASVPVNLGFRRFSASERFAAFGDVWSSCVLLFARSEAKWVEAFLKSIAFILSEPWLGCYKTFKQGIGALWRLLSFFFTNVLMRDVHLDRTVEASQVVRIKHASIYSLMHKCK